MEISSSQQSSITILTLDGRLDGESSPSLEESVNDHLANDCKQIIFDCSQLNYISSAGLRVFLISSKRTSAVAGCVTFCSLQPNIVEIFELSGFDNLFSSHADLDTALKSFS